MLEQLVQFLNALWLTIVPEGTLRLPDGVYSTLALAMRYWFLFLMALIVLLVFRWYRRDCRIQKKIMDYLPDAGHIGQMVVLQGDASLAQGTVLPVPREGTIGSLRTNDLCLPHTSVAAKHLRFAFDEAQGLMLYACGNAQAKADERAVDAHTPSAMVHGSVLCIGPYVLRLRLFAGFTQHLYQQAQAAAFLPMYYVAPCVPPVYAQQEPAANAEEEKEEKEEKEETAPPQTAEPAVSKQAASVKPDYSMYMRPKTEEPVFYPFADEDSESVAQYELSDDVRFDDDAFGEKPAMERRPFREN